MPPPIRLGVLLSGSGTTLQNLLERSADGRLPARVACVVSSSPTAFGLTRAADAGVPAAVVARKAYPSLEEFSAGVFAPCRAAGVDLVCMAGFLHLVRIPDDFRGRVMNIHPSLIPAFCGQGFHGLRVHAAVLEAGVKVTGCTVHFADDQYDHGPIILQKAVEVADDDTPEALQARVFARECDAYPEAIALYGAGRLAVQGRRVRWLGG